MLSLAVALAACHGGSSSAVSVPAPEAELPALVSQAAQEAGAGRYGVADRILADFTARYPASSEGAECMYWRAIYKLDPANPNAAPREAIGLLDGYAANPNAPHRVEAVTLRRLAAVLEMRTSAIPTIVQRPAVDATADKSKDEEMDRLKDELAKANAELDRIKKRLAQPTKP